MKRYVLTLDLKNDPEMIREYESLHRQVWPEIIASIRDSGIEQMEIYRMDTRLCMIIEVNNGFSFEKKQQADNKNPRVQEWEQLMWQFQQPLPGSAPGEKWKLMDPLFTLKEA